MTSGPRYCIEPVRRGGNRSGRYDAMNKVRTVHCDKPVAKGSTLFCPTHLRREQRRVEANLARYERQARYGRYESRN